MFNSKPSALVCHLCGRQYGTKSIQIHFKQCAARWERDQSVLPAKLRSTVPQPPETPIPKSNRISSQVEKYNAEAFKIYSQSLTPCPGCNRRFAPDSLLSHLKSCSAGQKALEGSPKSSQKPNALVCHLCGQLFGSASLNIHLKTCEKLYMVQQQRLPSTIQKSSPPSPPSIALPKNLRDTQAVERYNEEAFKVYNESCLNRCPYCSRSFNVDALLGHLDSCPAKKSGAQEGAFTPETRRKSNERNFNHRSSPRRVRSRSNSRLAKSMQLPSKPRPSDATLSSTEVPQKLSSRMFKLDLEDQNEQQRPRTAPKPRKQRSSSVNRNSSSNLATSQSRTHVKASMDTCSTCGTFFVENANFCFECGSRRS